MGGPGLRDAGILGRASPGRRTLDCDIRLRGPPKDASRDRLARRALDGTKYQHLGNSLKGPTAIAYSTDPVAAAKVAVEYAAKNEKLTIVAGGRGERVLDVAAVKALATLPSLPEMRAKFLGLLVAPATRLATVIGAPAAQVARVIGAYAKKQDAA